MKEYFISFDNVWFKSEEDLNKYESKFRENEKEFIKLAKGKALKENKRNGVILTKEDYDKNDSDYDLDDFVNKYPEHDNEMNAVCPDYQFICVDYKEEYYEGYVRWVREVVVSYKNGNEIRMFRF